MRIVGGEFRGRKLFSPEGRQTRPTSDRARQAVFNIIEHAPWAGMDVLTDAYVLDAFAGTGALGLEALSRGASDAVFIDQSTEALACCQKNIAALKLAGRAKTIRANAAKLPPRPADIAQRSLVFLDPPYAAGLGAACLLSLGDKDWLAPNALCVFETSSKAPEEIPSAYAIIDTRDYGAARVLFLRKA